MPDYGVPVATYRAALIAEVNIPGIPKERKAAIVAELESLGPRTADEDRAAFEAATLGPVTVGRAASNDVVQVADLDDAPVLEDAPPVVPSTTGSVPVTAGEGGN